MIAEDKGDNVAVREIRKHVGWYVKGMHGAAALRRTTNLINNRKKLVTVLNDFVKNQTQ
jgi:tRNA-dihydrouridine synthase B